MMLMEDGKIDERTSLVLEMARTLGASAVGITTRETIDPNEPTMDYDFVLKGARSAVTFAVPFGEGDLDEIVERSLAKKDHKALETMKVRATTLANGIAFEMSGLLNQIGCEAVPVHANYVYRSDMPPERRVPPLSHKLLALRSGVGHAGYSGLIITREHGANIALASVVTKADLRPTEALPAEDNYCDRCRLCAASCLSNYITAEKLQGSVGTAPYVISKKGHPMRCAFVCGGVTGMTRKAEWSTWSPARFDVPDDDEEMLEVLRNKGQPAQVRRNREVGFDGGFFHPFYPGYRNEYVCSLCQYVCHPDPEVRRRRFELLKNSGVSVPREGRGYRSASPEEAEAIFAKMPEDRRKIYM